MNAETLLALLSNVRETGAASWRADCPNGHSHARGSLSIAETTDGTVLLHCFVGCGAAEIVHAVGLELRDLFPEKISNPTPEGRRAAREAFRRSAWTAALGVLAREAIVVRIAGNDLLTGRPPNPADDARLTLALQCIEQAREVLSP